jgi:hypothetical protein
MPVNRYDKGGFKELRVLKKECERFSLKPGL